MLNHRTYSRVTICFLTIFVFTSGCGQKAPSDMPKTYPCSVKVTKGGAPVVGANILLFSTKMPGSLATSGQTDAEGKAEINSSYANYFAKGAPAGELTVVIQKTPDIPDSLKLTPSQAANLTPPEANAHAAKVAKAMQAAPKIVPDKLASPATSPLKITVAESKQGTEAVFELDDIK